MALIWIVVLLTLCIVARRHRGAVTPARRAIIIAAIVVSGFHQAMAGGPRKHSEAERAAFIRALAELDRALDGNIARGRRIKQRISELREACASGEAIREIVPREVRPLIVELLSENIEVLHTYGAELRQAEARVLHREGMTMDQIAELFGVTRQRVASLIREP